MKSLSHLTILLMLFTAVTLVAQSNGPKEVKFSVHEAKTGKLYYHGTEKVTYGSLITKQASYLTPEGTLALSESSSFEASNYKLHNFRYKNHLTGKTLEVDLHGDTYTIRSLKDKSSDWESKKLPYEENMTHGQCFRELVIREWKKLSSDQAISFKLISPSRFSAYRFEIVRDSSDENRYLLQPQSFFLKQMVPDMWFTIKGQQKPSIKSFTGPTELPINGKTNQIVEVRFEGL